jgi:hypothetical protein
MVGKPQTIPIEIMQDEMDEGWWQPFWLTKKALQAISQTHPLWLNNQQNLCG